MVALQKGRYMPERLAEILNSKIIDGLVKIAVPVLIGVSGYFFAFILDTTSRITAIESSRFKDTDGRALQEKIAEHDTQLMVLDSSQRRVVSTLDKVVDSQTLMLQTQSRIEANLEQLMKGK